MSRRHTVTEVRRAKGRGRRRGSALVLMVMLGMVLVLFSMVSLESTLTRGQAAKTQREVFNVRQIAESAAAQALARIKEGGFVSPHSGSGSSPAWVNFAGGAYYYETTFNAATETSSVRAWGRIASSPSPSNSVAAPDSVAWDGTGWMVRGVEITVQAYTYIPESPVYFGNGGVEKPLGGFEWTSGSDPKDKSTWSKVTSNPASVQNSAMPFEASALDHPGDFLFAGGSPIPASATPHPYSVFASQNEIGQFNVMAWFDNSAGSGKNPKDKVTPPPHSGYYNNVDTLDPNHPFPVDSSIPDAQSFSSELWNTYRSASATNLLSSGSRSGTYGDLSDPQVTFVTGELRVDAGRTFSGTGILVVRDDYDPNSSTNNQPSTKANLVVNGTFQWTGLVIIAGWAPGITVNSGGEATIVGALFGEDSVMSGGETSLDSATITLNIQDDMRILYSNALFAPGGLINPFLPRVRREVVGIRDL